MIFTAGGLDVPIDRPFAVRDWRFGKYEMEGLQDPVSCFVRYIREGAMFNRRRKQQKKLSNTQSNIPNVVPVPAEEKSLAAA